LDHVPQGQVDQQVYSQASKSGKLRVIEEEHLRLWRRQ
jgi:hypothetical protein